MTTASDFDLTAVAIDLLDSDDGITSPRELASALLRAVPADRLRDALQQALPAYASTLIVGARRFSQDPPTTKPPAKANQSWKVRLAWERRVKRDRIPGADGEWKTLAEATERDLLAAAHALTEQAQKLIGKAERYEKLARVLAEHGADTVADLPDGVLAATFGGDM